jgi:hypothetical protein
MSSTRSRSWRLPLWPPWSGGPAAGARPTFPRWTLAFPLIVAFLLTNKVYSAQYSLWLLPWFALALPSLRLFVAFEVADIAVFVTQFSWFGTASRDQGVPGFDGFAGPPLGALELALVARALVLVACLVAWIRSKEEDAVIVTREVESSAAVLAH